MYSLYLFIFIHPSSLDIRFFILSLLVVVSDRSFNCVKNQTDRVGGVGEDDG